MIEFAYPYAALLLPLPFLLRWIVSPEDRQSGALSVPPALVNSLQPVKSLAVARRANQIAPVLIWLLAVLAVTGPRQEQVLDMLPTSGRDIIIALDLSGSMEREDFDLDGVQVSRLAAVQKVAAEFVRGRDGDSVGLVVFGDKAYVAAPPTHDVSSVANVVERTIIGISGKSTAIADGLGIAIKRLRERDAKSRVIILLSDGQDTSGSTDPVAAAQVAAELDMRIYTIALGPADLETAPKSRDAVDTATLREIADAAEGQMFRVRTTDDLRGVTEAIDRLEPSPSSAPPIRTWRPYWIWPAGAAVALLGALLFVRRENWA